MTQDPQLLERAAGLAQKCSRQGQEIIVLKRQVDRLRRELAQAQAQARPKAPPQGPETHELAPTPQEVASGPLKAPQGLGMDSVVPNSFDDMELQKQLLAHVPLEFVLQMGQVFEDGLRGSRLPGDWKQLPPETHHGKLKSLLGHAATGEFVAAACNALILWWHRERPGKEAT